MSDRTVFAAGPLTRFVLLFSLALLPPATPRLCAQTNYELGVAAKLTEIKWKEADLQAAQRELAVLNQFLGGYEANVADLAAARQQLQSADAQLATLQQSNVVKLTIRMGIETYNTVADTINLGKTAATSLISNGLTSAVGGVAFDQLTGNLTSGGQKALGMDAASLSTHRTVKITAVSDAARATFPSLDRVQRMMGLSLEAVQSAAFQQDGTELGTTGAILRKNIMVRDEIATALASLQQLDSQTATAREDADERIGEVQADIDRLVAEMAALQNELADLQANWRASEIAALAAAAAEQIIPPVNRPLPSVVVTPEEGETSEEYAARVKAAIADAALAQWAAESPAVLTEITRLQDAILAVDAAMAVTINTALIQTDVASFLSLYRDDETVAAATTTSFSGSIQSFSQLDTWIAAVTPAVTALGELKGAAQGLLTHYTDLTNAQNRLASLTKLLANAEVSPLPSTGQATFIPGPGETAAAAAVSDFQQQQVALEAALANASVQRDQLALATATWSGSIDTVAADLDANLHAAEAALAVLVTRAADWNARLASSPGLTLDFAASPLLIARLGTFSGSNFNPIVDRVFDLPTYQSTLLAAIATPGDDGLEEARQVRARYDALVMATPSLKDGYDAAWQVFQTALGRLNAYADDHLDLPIYRDWTLASRFHSEQTPVDSSGVSDQADRYQSLHFNTYGNFTTSPSGGPPIVGLPTLLWHGVPTMKYLPDVGMDDPETYLPHRLLALKARIAAEGPTWLDLSWADFSTHYNEAMNAVFALQDDAAIALGSAAEAPLVALFGDLGTVLDAYHAAHPGPIIAAQPQGGLAFIEAGATHTAQLSVTATGSDLSYQWQITATLSDELGWQDLAGAESSTLTTPPLTETRWFRVIVTNPDGSATSEPAMVEVYQTNATPVFTSPAFTTAVAGRPFAWTFTSLPSGPIFTDAETLPDGLTLNPMTGVLSGTPTTPGIYTLLIAAFNFGTEGYQSFELTVTEPVLPPFEAWINAVTTSVQRADSAFTAPLGTPAADGVCNLLKYAFNLIGSGPNQAVSLDVPNSSSLTPAGNAGLPVIAIDSAGHLTVTYLRRRVAAASGITYTVQFSPTLDVASWAAEPRSTESVTVIDSTWERVQLTYPAPVAHRLFARVRVELH